MIGNDRVSSFFWWYQKRPSKTRITRRSQPEGRKSLSAEGISETKTLNWNKYGMFERQKEPQGGPRASERMVQDTFEEIIRIQVTKDLVGMKFRFYFS